MDLYLKGKHAVITGASQGIGRAIAKELALEGVQILAVGRNQSLLDSLKDEIMNSGGIEPITLAQDLTAVNGPQKIAMASLDALGHVDILVNNAGKSNAMDVIGSEEGWAFSMLLDFTIHRQLTQLLLPQFIERKQGAIINLTSTYELRTVNGSAVAKAAITAWSKQLAGELGKYNIRVNCLQPGLIDTENIRPLFPGDEGRLFASQEIPLGTFGNVQDMANMATFLASPRAKYITGSVYAVDGGLRRHAF